MSASGWDLVSLAVTDVGSYSLEDFEYEQTRTASSYQLAANTDSITSAMYLSVNTPTASGVEEPASNIPNTTESDCYYERSEYLTEKFALVSVFGTSVCIIGFINNCLLVHILARSSMIKTHVFYLAVLAVCDIIVAISYIAVMSIQVFYDYFNDLQLYITWNRYLRVIYTLSHVALTVATYMIVSASAERYLASSKSLFHGSCTRRHRWLVTLAVCIFAFLSRGLVYWELEVVYKPECGGFEMYTVQPSSLALDPHYKIGVTLWFRHIAHVFFPFILLLCLNGAILSRLKRTPLERVHAALVTSSMGQLARERKKSIRAATLMLAAMVSTYLISNLLSVVITIWEHIDLAYLKSQPKFYTFAADVITLLTVFTGAIRFPLYCICNQQLKIELRRLCKPSWRKSRVLGKQNMYYGTKENTGKENGHSACVYADNQNGYYHTLENGHGIGAV